MVTQGGIIARKTRGGLPWATMFSPCGAEKTGRWKGAGISRRANVAAVMNWVGTNRITGQPEVS
jgi:hypothetical protein